MYHHIFPFRLRQIKIHTDSYFKIIVDCFKKFPSDPIDQLASECACLGKPETRFRQYFIKDDGIKIIKS